MSAVKFYLPKQKSGKQVNPLPSHEPFKFLAMDIFELSSRRHLIAGSGLPVALHRSVTLAFSRTITSLDVVESSMFGGTAEGNAEVVN